MDNLHETVINQSDCVSQYVTLNTFWGLNVPADGECSQLEYKYYTEPFMDGEIDVEIKHQLTENLRNGWLGISIRSDMGLKLTHSSSERPSNYHPHWIIIPL